MTTVWTVDPLQPDPILVERAAAILRRGGLVAFPTETVYGLGANAFDEIAVKGIFLAKGRPNTNPVIVHVSERADVSRVAQFWPESAERLAQAFWPGPLTLVLPKSEQIPDAITAGGPTVAVRCPNHPVARALISAAGVPLAAPSANRSTELSPTRAEHVLKSLNGRIDAILDGGACPGGIESTVVDLTDGVRILRPGLITAAQIEAIAGPLSISISQEAIARSPGLMAKHYSPRTPVILVRTEEELAAFDDPRTAILKLDADPIQAAAHLYASLHERDDGRFERIVILMPPDEPAWAAIRDRLIRSAHE